MKTNLDKFFKTDAHLEAKGVWFEVSDGVRFLVSRFGGMNSMEVKKAMAKYHRPYAKSIERGTLRQDQERKINAQVFVEACLLNWEGVEVDGEVLLFSKEKAVELFCQLPELLDTLFDYSSSTESYKEDVGN